MEEREYKEGEIILKEGDPSDFVLRIVIGEAEVYTENDHHPVILGTVKMVIFLGNGCNRETSSKCLGAGENQRDGDLF